MVQLQEKKRQFDDYIFLWEDFLLICPSNCETFLFRLKKTIKEHMGTMAGAFNWISVSFISCLNICFYIVGWIVF